MPSRSGCSAPSPALKMPSSRDSAACTATPSSIRRSCSMRPCGSRPRRTSASPARSPAAKAMSKSAAIGLLAGRFAARGAEGRDACRPASHHGSRRPARPHHRRRRCRKLSADERQFRPVPADRRPNEEGRPQEALYRSAPRLISAPGSAAALRRLRPRTRPRRRRRIFGPCEVAVAIGVGLAELGAACGPPIPRSSACRRGWCRAAGTGAGADRAIRPA